MTEEISSGAKEIGGFPELWGGAMVDWAYLKQSEKCLSVEKRM
jgi:hypothetical protein